MIQQNIAWYKIQQNIAWYKIQQNIARYKIQHTGRYNERIWVLVLAQDALWQPQTALGTFDTASFVHFAVSWDIFYFKNCIGLIWNICLFNGGICFMETTDCIGDPWWSLCSAETSLYYKLWNIWCVRWTIFYFADSIWDPKRPLLIFLGRLNFGLRYSTECNSVIEQHT